MYELRQYQHEAVEVMLGTKQRKPSLIALPTGSGKSVIFASFISHIEGRVLVVVPNGELRDQSLQKIKALSPDADVGMVQSNLFDDVQCRIVIATRQSLTSKKSTRMKRMLSHGNFHTVIFDETHQAMLQIQSIISSLNKDCRVVGLTATPWNEEMLEVFKEINYSKSIVDMIDLEYLCEPLAYRIRSKTDLNSVRVVGGEFNQKDLEDAVNNEERNALVVEAYKKYSADRLSTLVFATGIEHINSLVTEFTNQGIYAKGLHSKNDKTYRKDVLEEFASGKLGVLINCGILTTGYDYPRLDSLILARPTKSRILYTQCIGRGLRTHPEKSNCLIIDIVDISRKHDLIDMNTMFEVDFKNGETIKDVKERKKKEKEEREEQEAMKELERIKNEEKKIRVLKEQELEAQKINLFSNKIKNMYDADIYDWFKINNITFALSYSSETHIVIENINDCFIIYEASTAKANKNIEHLVTLDTQSDALDYIHRKMSFINSPHLAKGRVWKSEPATDKQLQYCPNASTKWDVHKSFAINGISNLMRKSN